MSTGDGGDTHRGGRRDVRVNVASGGQRRPRVERASQDICSGDVCAGEPVAYSGLPMWPPHMTAATKVTGIGEGSAVIHRRPVEGRGQGRRGGFHHSMAVTGAPQEGEGGGS